MGIGSADWRNLGPTHLQRISHESINAEIGEAKKDAAEDKRDANYDVAAQKCEAMSGDAKASCIAAAKAKFGKN